MLDCVDLCKGSVFVVQALDGEDGSVDGAELRADVEGVEARREPAAGPIPEETACIGAVVAHELFAHAGGVGVDGGANAGAGDVFNEQVGGFRDDASGLRNAGERGVEESDGAAIAVADQDDVGGVLRGEKRAERVRFVMEIIGLARARARGGFAVSATIVDEGGATGGFGKFAGEVAPEGDAAEAVMEEDERGSDAVDAFHMKGLGGHHQIIIVRYDTARILRQGGKHRERTREPDPQQ